MLDTKLKYYYELYLNSGSSLSFKEWLISNTKKPVSAQNTQQIFINNIENKTCCHTCTSKGKGRVGRNGHQGIQGIKGEQGLQGVAGEASNQGVQGLQGFIGEQGVQGIQGIQGFLGLRGNQGTQGTTGSQGLQGSQGEVGLQGLQGSQGIKGTNASVGRLNTNNSSAQTPSSSEYFSSNISLHKVSKTGNYNDLLNKPTIPSISNVSATIGDSQTCGYFSGSISITSNNVTTCYNFIINPARPVLSIDGEYSTENQGVVRPLYEIDRTDCELADTPELNDGVSYNYKDLLKQNIRISLYGLLQEDGEKIKYSDGTVLLPIVTIYRKNKALQLSPDGTTERVEAIPCIAFPSSIFSDKADFATFASELAMMYAGENQIVYFDCK